MNFFTQIAAGRKLKLKKKNEGFKVQNVLTPKKQP